MTLKKTYDLVAAGSIGFDLIEFVTLLTDDGRNDLMGELAPRPSGLGANGLGAARSLLPGSRVAVAGVAGNADGPGLKAALERNGIDTRYVFLIRGGRTARQRVALAPDGKRLITRLPGSVSADTNLSPQHVRAWKGMFAQARAGIIAHLCPDLTTALLGWAAQVETFTALAPGPKQYASLADYQPDLLILNVREAAAAVGAPCGEKPAAVFGHLLGLTQAQYVVMTGGGEHPSYFADRARGLRGTACPADLARVVGPAEHPSGVGCGDIMTCVLARTLSLGQALDVAVDWARLYVTAHLRGLHFATRRQAEAWRAENGDAFPPLETASLPRLAA